jgi:nanoRNase/pAp phosphatase (c-di-AMP/oligoRNAs hydrolase)
MGHIAHFTLSLCLFLPLPLTIAQDKPAYEQRNQPVTKEDLQILQRADKILSSEAVWNRNDTRVCKPEDKTWSLFCALQKASIEILGSYDHRRVALQEVRFVIEEVAKGKDLGGHRLMGYNNLPSTQFKDIKRVLKMATEKVAARLKAQQRA